MVQVTVSAGKKITVADGVGNVRTYTAGQQPFIPAADAAKFIRLGLCVGV